jgi:hypothetical protein
VAAAELIGEVEHQPHEHDGGCRKTRTECHRGQTSHAGGIGRNRFALECGLARAASARRALVVVVGVAANSG